jgi:hypothetical protein
MVSALDWPLCKPSRGPCYRPSHGLFVCLLVHCFGPLANGVRVCPQLLANQLLAGFGSLFGSETLRLSAYSAAMSFGKRLCALVEWLGVNVHCEWLTCEHCMTMHSRVASDFICTQAIGLIGMANTGQ